MKAIFIERPGEVDIKEIPYPVRKPGEALLKPLYGGICGSDLGSYRGTFAYFSYPRTPGHEFSAEIVEIEDNDQGLEPGMIVVCNPYFNCGRCYSCRRGLVNACMDNQTMGVQREGAFSEYIAMPINRIYDGRGLEPRTLAAVEPLCISYHAIKQADVRAGEKVLVIGAGTIGILAALSAKQRGAIVYLADVSERKLQYAKELGVDGVFLADKPNAYEKAVKNITEGGGFDVAIEAVGLPSTFQFCIDAAAFGGKVVLIGVGKLNLDFNFTMIQKKELNIFGSRNARKEDFLEAIDMVKAGTMPLERIITNEYKFLDADRAFKELDENAGSMLKVLIDFTYSGM